MPLPHPLHILPNFRLDDLHALVGSLKWPSTITFLTLQHADAPCVWCDDIWPCGRVISPPVRNCIAEITHDQTTYTQTQIPYCIFSWTFNKMTWKVTCVLYAKLNTTGLSSCDIRMDTFPAIILDCVLFPFTSNRLVQMQWYAAISFRAVINSAVLAFSQLALAVPSAIKLSAKWMQFMSRLCPLSTCHCLNGSISWAGMGQENPDTDV